VFNKISVVETQTMGALSAKANHEDFKLLAEEKVDMQVMKTYLNQKVCHAEVDQLR
jgi:hypothetical protein